jgi:enterochelin esterase-like enzyme
MNMKLLSTFFFLLSLMVARGQQIANPAPDHNFILGKTEVIHSAILSEDRTLNIYLPEGYDPKLKYPVIYLLDGSADEDFIHVAGIVQFNTFPWVDRMPKSILVGIANTNRKYNFTSQSDRSSDLKRASTLYRPEIWRQQRQYHYRPILRWLAGYRDLIYQTAVV